MQIAERRVTVDLARSFSLARPIEFAGRGLQHFGAPAASTQPLTVPGFSGAVTNGASCNCSTITLTPHCNGTHTECVGHLTRDAVDAYRLAPAGFLPALLLTVTPVAGPVSNESTEPAPKSGDLLITRQALAEGWPARLLLEPRALVVRTNSSGSDPPPYLTRDAAQLLVERGIEHLIVDLPSVDRTQDEGRLTTHRVFFGLPRDSHALADSKRPHCTITELASIPREALDGLYLLELQVPAIAGDAVPSRPLLHALL